MERLFMEFGKNQFFKKFYDNKIIIYLKLSIYHCSLKISFLNLLSFCSGFSSYFLSAGIDRKDQFDTFVGNYYKLNHHTAQIMMVIDMCQGLDYNFFEPLSQIFLLFVLYQSNVFHNLAILILYTFLHLKVYFSLHNCLDLEQYFLYQINYTKLEESNGSFRIKES